MCLYPKLINNPKYRGNKKNGYNAPICTDERIKKVPIACGQCMECKKKKSREWQIRLLEHIKTNTNGKFVTFTFSEQAYEKLLREVEEKIYEVVSERKYNQYEKENMVATRAIRLFTENWRSKYKKSIQHWFVTELGQSNTERIHIHGIIWTGESNESIKNKWTHGHTFIGEYVNQRTVNYIVKYVNKVDEKHRYYKPTILCSPGIGNNYTRTYNSQANRYNKERTDETYRTPTGHKISLPIYWRNKIYTEEQREQLWIYKINKQIRWVMSEKVDISQGEQEYFRLLAYYQNLNVKLGYNDNTIDWDKKKYELQRRNLKRKPKLNNWEEKCKQDGWKQHDWAA